MGCFTFSQLKKNELCNKFFSLINYFETCTHISIFSNIKTTLDSLSVLLSMLWSNIPSTIIIIRMWPTTYFFYQSKIEALAEGSKLLKIINWVFVNNS